MSSDGPSPGDRAVSLSWNFFACHVPSPAARGAVGEDSGGSRLQAAPEEPAFPRGCGAEREREAPAVPPVSGQPCSPRTSTGLWSPSWESLGFQSGTGPCPVSRSGSALTHRPYTRYRTVYISLFFVVFFSNLCSAISQWLLRKHLPPPRYVTSGQEPKLLTRFQYSGVGLCARACCAARCVLPEPHAWSGALSSPGT